MNFGNKIKIFNYRPLVSICLFLMAGIIFAAGLHLESVPYFVLSLIMFVFFCVTIVTKAVFSKEHKLFKVISIVVAFVIAAGLTFTLLNIYDNSNNLSGDYYLRGRVYSHTTTSNAGLKVVSLDNVTVTSHKTGKTEKLNCSVRLYLDEGDGRTKDFELGEIVEGSFSLKKAEYLRDSKADFYLTNKNIKILGFGAEDDIESTGKFHLNIFDKIKNKLKSVLDVFMTSEYSELGYTMLFGDKSNLDESIYDSYSASGISHLLAVSGLHVGFVVTLFALLLSIFKANDKVKFYVISIATFLYAFMCGFTVSVTRAFIMTVVLLFSRLRKRKYDSLSSLALAAIIILLWNPLFIFDIGFILSFSAVASIILFGRAFTSFFERFLHGKLASALAISLAVSIGTTLPLMMSFEKLSIFSIITNVIVIPIASVAFMIMFVFVLLAVVVEPLGVFIYLFEALMSVVTGVSKITGAINLAGMNTYLVFSFGVLLIASAMFFSDYIIMKRKHKAVMTLTSFALCLVSLLLMLIC